MKGIPQWMDRWLHLIKHLLRSMHIYAVVVLNNPIVTNAILVVKVSLRVVLVPYLTKWDWLGSSLDSRSFNEDYNKDIWLTNRLAIGREGGERSRSRETHPKMHWYSLIQSSSRTGVSFSIRALSVYNVQFL